jgi:hypothetical protein
MPLNKLGSDHYLFTNKDNQQDWMMHYAEVIEPKNVVTVVSDLPKHSTVYMDSENIRVGIKYFGDILIIKSLQKLQERTGKNIPVAVNL